MMSARALPPMSVKTQNKSECERLGERQRAEFTFYNLMQLVKLLNRWRNSSRNIANSSQRLVTTMGRTESDKTKKAEKRPKEDEKDGKKSRDDKSKKPKTSSSAR